MRSYRAIHVRLSGVVHCALAVLLAAAVVPLCPQAAVAAVEGTTARVSLTDGDAQASDRSQEFSVSADGRYVAFASYAKNLVPGTMTALTEVFVRDNFDNTTKLVSVSSAGVRGDAESAGPAISPDGRYVAFYSHASNLVSGDTNYVRDIFVRDLQLNTTVRVSVSSTGAQANGQSTFPSICFNGQKVAFSSDATNLIGAGVDSNGQRDVFVKNLSTGAVTLESRSSGGTMGNGESQRGVLSANGGYLAFDSQADNLVAGDTNGATDVFIRTLGSGITNRLSVSDASAQGNSLSQNPAISADGRYVTFNSYATNLVAGDTNALCDVFLRDVSLGGTIKRVNVATSNAQANVETVSAINQQTGVTSDGRYVVFTSGATNLLGVGPGADTNGHDDVFVRDMLELDTKRVSITSTGDQPNANSGYGVAISSGARFVTFGSEATNMVANDTNAKRDIFRHVYIGNEIDIAGMTRYETAIAASKELYPGPMPLAGKLTVIIATAHNWPDALGGAALAGVMGAPILLVDTNSVPNDVLDEIDRLGAERAIILGGESAVGPLAAQTLKNGLGELNVKRIAGASRYETADLIALSVIDEHPGYTGDAFVATGANFPDALAAAPIAARHGRPLFLSHPVTGLSSATKTIMETYVNDAVIIGGNGAVSLDVHLYLDTFCDNVLRLTGADRYTTAVNVADWGVNSAGMQWYKAGIATGEKFPDALAGSVLQAQTSSVMLLTKTNELPAVTAAALTAHKGPIIWVQIFGGVGAVSMNVRNDIEVAMQ